MLLDIIESYCFVCCISHRLAFVLVFLFLRLNKCYYLQLQCILGIPGTPFVFITPSSIFWGVYTFTLQILGDIECPWVVCIFVHTMMDLGFIRYKKSNGSSVAFLYHLA